MATLKHAMQNAVKNAPKKIDKRQARKVLVACGIMNQNNEVTPAYKPVLTQFKKAESHD